jgi:2-oxoglutarate dehydrogenase E1 component
MAFAAQPCAWADFLPLTLPFPCRFFIGTWHQSGFLSESRPTRTLREILTRLRETYCGSIGYEYMHIPDTEKCDWIREKIETIEPPKYTQKEKLQILDRLAWAEMFETFLANKHTSAKRFGLEGGETLIPGMKQLIDVAADQGVESVVIGMPHRGRAGGPSEGLRKSGGRARREGGLARGSRAVKRRWMST